MNHSLRRQYNRIHKALWNAYLNNEKERIEELSKEFEKIKQKVKEG